MVSHVLQQAPALILGRQICGNWDDVSRYEWLVTNGLGGYASGTVALANTRRYHGFLMASLAPPVERTLLVAKIELSVDYQGQRVDLTANEFAGGNVSPQGFVHLESFAVQSAIPTWRYAIGDALLQAQIFMAPGANTTYLRLELLRASQPMRVSLKPFAIYRDYHSHSRGTHPYGLESDGAVCRIQTPAPARGFRLMLSEGLFTAEPAWYWNFWHREEAERGLDALEDLWVPGFFSADLQTQQPLFLTATCEAAAPADGAEVLDALVAKARRQLSAIPKTAPKWIRALTLAADQFVVKRGDATEGVSLIAGYPWFADWGRDTMISLPGLATVLGRYDIAAGILKTYAAFVNGGMLPNRFPDGSGGAPPEYNTADATLWMFHALDDYLHARRDADLVQQLLPTLISIIHAHADGTRYGIHVDPADGLLCAGEPGTQLTWMDAKHGDTVFTPRMGKPVEINALWLNALDVTARLTSRTKNIAEKHFCETLLAQARAGFGRFWNAQKNCLYDVIDIDGAGHDDRVRPNQIFAVSLPYCALNNEQMRAVVDCVGRDLLTSYGLRSLSPKENGYIGRYNGDARQRDSAYHMGTAWGWLLGPYVRAHFQVYGNARFAQSLLDPIAQHVDSACMGSISEIFDGDAPHTARGCFAQAWSVAEILRSWLLLERSISTS
jgi:predicted glycogen debranching enzyme